MKTGKMIRYGVVLITVGAVATVPAGCRRANSPRTIVCIGDSLTACGGEGGRYSDWMAKLLPGHVIINKGINGDTLAGGRARFAADVLDLKPDIVVIALGANDFWRMQRDISQLKADMEDMVGRAKEASIEVVLASCFGQREYEPGEDVEYEAYRYDFARAIAKMEQEIVAEYDCFYVSNMQVDIKPNGREPYWADKLHPNSKGNKFVAERIAGELKKALKRTGG
ncbi:MAG: GDSL-type esterase/lipase family protein [Planctomycetota bacterium]